MTALIYRNPEADVVELRLVYAGDVFIRNWTRYEFNSNYETPTDGWSFSIGDDDLPKRLRDELYPGAAVELSLNGLVQGTGYIDKVRRHVTRGGGTEWEIVGRDRFSPVVDAHIDPRMQFKKDMTVEQVIRAVFENFGFTEIVFDSDANHKIKTGRPRGRKGGATGAGTGKGKARAGKQLDQFRPNQHEGAFQFAAKIANRQGLTIQPSVDGAEVILGHPNYVQEPTHTLFRTAIASNILDGTVEWSVMDQPSIIIADGMSGGGEFGHSQIMAKMVNPFTGVDRNGQMWPDVKMAYDRYPQATELFFEAVTYGQEYMRWPRQYHSRPIFLHDESARNAEELEFFLRREMSLKVRKALGVTYTLEGHGLYTPEGAFVPFATDTIVRVKDEPGGVDAALWVLGRTFMKDRSGGTTTRLELIIPGTLQFGEA